MTQNAIWGIVSWTSRPAGSEGLATVHMRTQHNFVVALSHRLLNPVVPHLEHQKSLVLVLSDDAFNVIDVRCNGDALRWIMRNVPNHGINTRVSTEHGVLQSVQSGDTTKLAVVHSRTGTVLPMGSIHLSKEQWDHGMTVGSTIVERTTTLEINGVACALNSFADYLTGAEAEACLATSPCTRTSIAQEDNTRRVYVKLNTDSDLASPDHKFGRWRVCFLIGDVVSFSTTSHGLSWVLDASEAWCTLPESSPKSPQSKTKSNTTWNEAIEEAAESARNARESENSNAKNRVRAIMRTLGLVIE